MTWRHVVCFAASIAAFAAACAAFDSSPATDVGDAGNDVVGTGDGSSSGSDANDPSDAGVDADDGGPCRKPSLCANGVLHQFDFASGGVPPNLFATQIRSGTLEQVTTEEGLCSPGLVHATAKVPVDAGASAEAKFQRSITGAFQSAHLAFAFRGPKAVTGGYANIGCTLILRPSAAANPRTTIALSINKDRLAFMGNVRNADGGNVPTGPSNQVELDNAVSDLEAAAWRALDAHLEISTTNVKVSGTFEGKPFTTFESPLLAPPGVVTIECGITYADSAPVTHELDLDDVLIELCP